MLTKSFLSPPLILPIPSIPSVRRAPLLRLEFTCFSRTELTQVKNYFEKFANFNFPRQQIHYPRYNGLWLKEISAQKVRKIPSLIIVISHTFKNLF